MGLNDFLERAAATPFQPGTFDCCLWLADWGRELTGVDAAADWRGTYDDALGCLAAMRAQGGVAKLVRRGATDIGMKRLSEPQAGAVGIIRAVLPGNVRAHLGGLYTGQRWAFLTPEGIALSKCGHVAAWGL